MICLKVGNVKWVLGKCLDFAMGWNAHREGLLPIGPPRLVDIVILLYPLLECNFAGLLAVNQVEYH